MGKTGILNPTNNFAGLMSSLPLKINFLCDTIHR